MLIPKFVTGLNRVEGKFVTVCHGRYMVTVNIMIQDDRGSYEVYILYNGQETTKARKHITVDNGITTLNIYQVLDFKKGTVIEVMVKNDNSESVNLLKGSTWSVGSLGEFQFRLDSVL